MSRIVVPGDGLGTIGKVVEGCVTVREPGWLVEVCEASFHIWCCRCWIGHDDRLLRPLVGKARTEKFILNVRTTSGVSTEFGYRMALSGGDKLVKPLGIM